MTGLLTQQSSKNSPFLLHGSGCVPSAVWDFSSGTHGSFIFLPRNQFLGEVLSSEIEESQKQKKMVHPYRCTRFLKKDRRQVYFVTQSFAVFIVTAPTTLLEGLVCEHPFSRMNASASTPNWVNLVMMATPTAVGNVACSRTAPPEPRRRRKHTLVVFLPTREQRLGVSH